MDARYTCKPTGVFVCGALGQLTHTEGELYPLSVLHRKHVYSGCLCAAARFERESITSFPGEKGAGEERRGEECRQQGGIMNNKSSSIHSSRPFGDKHTPC